MRIGFNFEFYFHKDQPPTEYPRESATDSLAQYAGPQPIGFTAQPGRDEE